MNSIYEFEQMRNLAEARALSKVSLERPLSEREYHQFMNVCKLLGIGLTRWEK